MSEVMVTAHTPLDRRRYCVVTAKAVLDKEHIFHPLCAIIGLHERHYYGHVRESRGHPYSSMSK